MQVTGTEEKPRAPGPSPQPPLLSPPQPTAVSWKGAPLSTDQQGRRLLSVLAEAAYQQDQARIQRQKAREARGAAIEPWEAPHPPSPGPLALQGRVDSWDPDAHRDARSGPATAEARWLSKWALALQGRACEICLQSRMIRDQAREAAENRRLDRDAEAILSCPEFIFLEEEDALPSLDERRQEPDEAPPLLAEERWSLAALAYEMGVTPPRPQKPRAKGTTLYVWGYGRPQSALCRDRCQSSEATIRYALEAGWIADRPGAWARELRTPWGITAALRKLEPQLRGDPAVAGWELRMGPAG